MTRFLVLGLLSSLAGPMLAESKRASILRMADQIDKQFKVPTVDPQTLRDWQKTSDIVLVDVREDGERSVSVVPGAISYKEFQEHPAKYRDKKVIAYCTIGYRSAKVVQKLRAKGIKAWNLKGSILFWVHEKGEVVDPKGRTTQKVHVYGKDWDLLPSSHESIYDKGWFD